MHKVECYTNPELSRTFETMDEAVAYQEKLVFVYSEDAEVVQ